MDTTRKQQQNILLPPDLVREFREAAYIDRVSQNEMGEAAIRRFLADRKRKLDRKAAKGAASA